MKRKSGFPSRIRQLLRVILLLSLLALPALATQAQDDDRAGAPGNLSVESRDTGILLSWEAPASKDDPNRDYIEITDYLISGSHVRRGVGIVERVSGATDRQSTAWLDRQATDPDLLYVYRVRALFDGVPGQWSEFVITNYEWSADPTAVPPPPEPTLAGPEPDPTDLAMALTAQAPQSGPAAPTAVPPPSGPTAAPPDPAVELTAQAPQSGPTAARPEPEPTAAPPAADPPQQAADEPPAPTPIPPPPEPTAAPPVVQVEPTVPPPPPEPTAARPEPQPTAAPPAAAPPQQPAEQPPAPTDVPPPPEPTAAPPDPAMALTAQAP